MAITGGLSPSRLGRGLFRKGGRTSVSFHFLPGWEQATIKATRPAGRPMIASVHRTMQLAMREESSLSPGGGTEETAEGWRVGIGAPPATHTHWHLLEFGGGFHYARSPVRNALSRIGKFKAEKR